MMSTIYYTRVTSRRRTMKQNIYIFSNSALSRKDNTFIISSMKEAEALCDIDVCDEERECILLPAEKDSGVCNPKYVPAESIEAFYTFGEIRFNSQFLRCLQKYAIPLHAFNYYGGYIGTFYPVTAEGSGEIEILQYKAYCNEYERLKIAKAIEGAAIKNILSVLKTYKYAGAPLDEEIAQISSILETMRFAETIEELMGYEGTARTLYYQCWHEIFKTDVEFQKRIKRPPEGLVNSLISFGNSLLYAVCTTECYRTRLNPFIGFIHETGSNRHPLSYDIAEIYKPLIVDKTIFRVINLQMIDESDCDYTKHGWRLNEKKRKVFVEELEKRLSTVVFHKQLRRRISYRSLIRMEYFQLINYLTEKIKSYEPYKSE